MVDYFISRKEHYYTVDESTPPKWVNPTEEPTAIFFHDETTFKSGEQCSKRWYYNNNSNFISKGRGRSLMVSDFLMAHPSGPFFSLDDEEWASAIKKYPSLQEEIECNYEPQSCTGSMVPGQDGYFDNASILAQFERLFQMLEFKREFNYPVKHKIEIVVDNARTHTKLDVNINDFRLKPGGFCPNEYLEWIDENNNKQVISLYFKDGPNKGLSKDLKQISIELGMKEISHLKLPELKKELAKHPAFFGTTKLELLAKKYGVKIIFCPKYHCEVNPIEGLWCNQKQYVRSRTDQSYDKMLELINESREHFIEIDLNIHLIRRFWRVLVGYKNGASYADILKTYFSGKSKENNISHTKIHNTKLS